MVRMLASVGIPAILTCSSLGPMHVWMIGFFRWVTALIFITGSSPDTWPVYPGNSGMAFPVLVLMSSRIRFPATNSPSMTNSALAMAYSSMVRHFAMRTGFLRSAPAIDSSLNPKGVVGGSKQEAISMAGSTPMLMLIGRFTPSRSAFSRNASRWRTPGVKNMVISSADCRQRR